ncbi:MAG TPA: NAD-dependent epimerase/dehydratase family protein [Verrucomicrobiae bacterium]
MRTILVTGSEGFIGKNLCLALRRTGEFTVLGFDVANSADELPELARRAEVVFHLAGVNRPKDVGEFRTGNVDLTQRLCDALAAAGRRAPLVLSSSTQAELDNPYGESKREAEETVLRYHAATQAPVYLYRFPNVFGKWSRPNYNTVVATFCHNLSRGIPVQVSNPANVIRFIYVDDIVRAFLEIARRTEHEPIAARPEPKEVFTVTLGELHELLSGFAARRRQGVLPDLANPFVRYLYSTFVSFYDTKDFAYPVDLKTDERGWLFELIKSPHAGQIFVSRTKPGIARGNHYHDTKIEKFCVIQGEGVIRFRHVLGDEVVEYPVNDRAIQVVDIPPGYTHSIENTGAADMITLFWANEIFDPQRPETYFEKVGEGRGKSEEGRRQ